MKQIQLLNQARQQDGFHLGYKIKGVTKKVLGLHHNPEKYNNASFEENQQFVRISRHVSYDWSTGIISFY